MRAGWEGGSRPGLGWATGGLQGLLRRARGAPAGVARDWDWAGLCMRGGIFGGRAAEDPGGAAPPTFSWLLPLPPPGEGAGLQLPGCFAKQGRGAFWEV